MSGPKVVHKPTFPSRHLKPPIPKAPPGVVEPLRLGKARAHPVGDRMGTALSWGILILCMVLVSIFAFIVLRGLSRAMGEGDPFRRFAIAGLVVLIGFQSTINVAVNLQLMPAKGMTLPFISYGGSSMIAVALTAGFVLALTRRRPETRAGQVRFHGALGLEAAE